MQVTGTFEVKLQPVDAHGQGSEGNTLGRMSLDKTFFGPLAATSRGDMLYANTAVAGSAGYVALEQVTGTLSGRSGGFVLQHFGVMHEGDTRLLLEVVPNSGTGALVGLSGKMAIRIEEGQHFYDFDYEW